MTSATIILAIAVAMFSLLDIYLTDMILKANGREHNPAVRGLIAKFGVWPVGIVAKTLGAALAAWASIEMTGAPDWGLMFAALAWASACAWNWLHRP